VATELVGKLCPHTSQINVRGLIYGVSSGRNSMGLKTITTGYSLIGSSVTSLGVKDVAILWVITPCSSFCLSTCNTVFSRSADFRP
jgi:hypothetical protein